MKKTILAILLTATAVVAARTPPPVIGTLKNAAGGEIVLTTTTAKECKGAAQYIAYIRAKTGKVTLTGCHTLNNDRIIVFWNDGDVYEYPILDIDFDPEWLKYMKEVSEADAAEKSAT